MVREGKETSGHTETFRPRPLRAANLPPRYLPGTARGPAQQPARTQKKPAPEVRSRPEHQGIYQEATHTRAQLGQRCGYARLSPAAVHRCRPPDIIEGNSGRSLIGGAQTQRERGEAK